MSICRLTRWQEEPASSPGKVSCEIRDIYTTANTFHQIFGVAHKPYRDAQYSRGATYSVGATTSKTSVSSSASSPELDGTGDGLAKRQITFACQSDSVFLQQQQHQHPHR